MSRRTRYVIQSTKDQRCLAFGSYEPDNASKLLWTRDANHIMSFDSMTAANGHALMVCGMSFSDFTVEPV